MSIHNPATIAPPMGAYSNGISRPGGGTWLHIAGQVGVTADGTLAEGLEAQAHAAWHNVLAILANAGMGVADLVKINHYLVRAPDVAAYGAIRAGYLGDARPASTLVVVAALARAEWLVEVDAVAWHA